MRLYNKVQVLKLLNQHLGVYPTPMNLNWNWSFGSLSGLILGSQIVTGILLAMHYVGHVDHAFSSVQHLMVDVPSGLILRYAHANGASLFFTVVYLHILRGLYYSSGNQPREILWLSGVVILLLMIITAFIGYTHSQKWVFDSESWDTIQYLGLVHIERLTLFLKCYDNLHKPEIQLQILNENRHKAGVYAVLNKINSKLYIGSASSNRISVRFRNHCIHKTGGNVPLTRALNKYGLESFCFGILEYYPGFVHKEDLRRSHLKLLERETYFISLLKPEYNILQVAGSSLGFKHSEKTKVKMKLNYTGRSRIKNLNKGKPLSEEIRLTLSKSRRKLFTDSMFKADFLEKQKDFLFKGKKVQVYDTKMTLVSEYDSITMTSKVFNCDRKTIRKYLNNPDKMFRKIYYLRFKKV